VGNLLEWFDFAVYGCSASHIGQHFFPREDPVAQHLLANTLALILTIQKTGGRALDA